MGDKSNIEWCDATWNCLRGCTRVSEGCRNCYAEKDAYRFSGPGKPYEGLAVLKNGHASWTGEVKFIEDHLLDPIKWKRPRRIFVNSMSDVFHESVPYETIDKIFSVMALAPQHTFQLLTKRPERMLKYLTELRSEGWSSGYIALAYGRPARFFPQAFKMLPLNKEGFMPWPLPNVWLGTSVENQAAADERIPLLVQCPAKVHFISAEPLLGPIDLLYPVSVFPDGPATCCSGTDCACQGKPIEPPLIYGLQWVITGGESGPNARPCRLWWIRSIVDKCKNSRVPVFVKQMGGNITDEDQSFIQRTVGRSVRDRKGGDIDEFPLDLRVREFPEAAR